ncbi:unnamed protein product [Trichogramma brassicae]|uniref:Reverse transcriptase domain-containing protein n=1 Tax=Trichogramma brassicae TaxID=86971 RepID=A0A6H5IZU7_9HYME|nr:unnamed protein product [Trichogramma brassicae]
MSQHNIEATVRRPCRNNKKVEDVSDVEMKDGKIVQKRWDASRDIKLYHASESRQRRHGSLPRHRVGDTRNAKTHIMQCESDIAGAEATVAEGGTPKETSHTVPAADALTIIPIITIKTKLIHCIPCIGSEHLYLLCNILNNISHNLIITNVLEEVFTGARLVTRCTRSTECGLTLVTQSVKPINKENSRRRFRRGQIGDLVHQVDGMSRDVLTAFLDVEGAFDNVNVDILLERLASLGCTRRIVKFVQFVTRERLIFTEGATAAMRLCKGVPQGAVLSPLLYSLYVASLTDGLSPGVCTSQFADDVSVSVEAADPADGVVALESAIKTLGENLDIIGLGISPFKTKLIHFNDRNIQPGRQRIKIREHVVSSCSHTKFLGVIFDYRLSFKEHINYVKKKNAPQQ